MTTTLICPGYWRSRSILRAICSESSPALPSSIVVGVTTTRTSRPAWMANTFSTPGNSPANCSSCVSRLTYVSNASRRDVRQAAHAAPAVGGGVPRRGEGEPLDVRLERLAPRPGARARDGVGGLDDHADRRLVRHVIVMGGDAVDDGGMLAVLGGDVDADLDMGAVVLVREHLPDVVQQGPALGELHVELQLGGDHAGEPGDFLRVLEDVLPV